MKADNPSLDYPTSFAEIVAWSKNNRVPIPEARQRFAQYVILHAIASSKTLRELLVFKGGNALDFIWSPNRSTRDLDFSVDMAKLKSRDSLEVELEPLLSRVLVFSGRELGITAAVHSLKRQPPGEGMAWVTYTAKIGYALPDDLRNRTRLEQGESSTLVIPLEISINEPIGADQSLALSGTEFIRVSTLEDIVAEKLRAFLQQKGEIRNRRRPQDLLDIAHLLKGHRTLDIDDVSQFLLIKAEAREVPVSKAAFWDTELVDRASYGYEDLRDTVREDFVPFHEALELLCQCLESCGFGFSAAVKTSIVR